MGAVRQDGGNGGIQLVPQFVLTLAHAGADAAAHDGNVLRHFALDFTAGVGFRGDEIRHGNAVGLGGIDTARNKVLIGFVLRLIDDAQFGLVGKILMRIGLMGGRRLHADDLAGERFRIRTDIHGLVADDDTWRIVIGIGEIDGLLPLLGD